MSSGLIEFPDKEVMADRLADLISLRLGHALLRAPRALLAVSGGASPAPLYQRLSRIDLDWHRIDVLLVDERWVNPGEAGSNETFIRETLLQERAARARLCPLKTAHATPNAALSMVEARVRELPDVIDVAVLGMGLDGHTASWFPHAHHLDRAIDPHSDARTAAITAQASDITGAFLDRLTLTLAFITTARLPLLMITGDAKREVYLKALAEGAALHDYPVGALAGHCPDLWPCWAP